MALVGYARVSTTGQSLELQEEALKDCEKIYSEKLSGLDSDRPELKACLDYVRKGDTLVITKLDRLARSTLDLHKIKEKLDSKGVELKVIDQSIDTNTSTGKLLFSMLSAIAEFETNIRKERQADGIAKAKSQGKYKKNALTPDQITELKQDKDQGATIQSLIIKYGISKASIYRYVSQ